MENRSLKEENFSLKRRNKWLTDRLSNQSQTLKKDLETKRMNSKFGKRPQEETLISKILSWYYKVTEQMERILQVCCSGLHLPDFETALIEILR